MLLIFPRIFISFLGGKYISLLMIYSFRMCQFAPLDIPAVVDAFLNYWKPNAVILLESELWPNVVMAASESKVKL